MSKGCKRFDTVTNTFIEESLRSATPQEAQDFLVHANTTKEAIERRLKNARTLVLVAACAYIPTDETETTRQGFLSLEKAVWEYRAAVMENDLWSKRRVK